jgi:hypothetical protein
MGKRRHVASGRVSHISQHSDGKHINVSIKHGRRAPKKKDAAGSLNFQYDDRPESNLIVPKEDAANYHIGQRVDIAATPRQADVDEDGDADAQDLDTVNDMKSKAASGLFNATRRR